MQVCLSDEWSLFDIEVDFLVAGSISSFVPSIYLLTSTAFQPLYGRFSDIFGRKAALCLAMSVFMVGNLAAGFSRKISEVIIFRGAFYHFTRNIGPNQLLIRHCWCGWRRHCLDGANYNVGRCHLTGQASLGILIIISLLKLKLNIDRGKYQGIIGVVVAFGYGIGPLIGGALSEKVSWRVCCFTLLRPFLSDHYTIVVLLDYDTNIPLWDYCRHVYLTAEEC